MYNKSSFDRFFRLIVKHTAEHYRAYLMAAAVLAGVMLFGGAFLFFMMPDPPDTGFQNASFAMLLLLSGTIFTSTIFSDYGERNKATATIILPATNLEKFMVGWLFSYVIFLVVYTAIFYGVLLTLGNIRTWSGGRQFVAVGLGKEIQVIVFVLYSFLHSIALVGAICFKRLHFIKTAFLFFLGLAFLVALNGFFLHAITGADIVKNIPFGTMNFLLNGQFYVLEGEAQQAPVILILIFLVSALLWVTAYYKLKERQA